MQEQTKKYPPGSRYPLFDRSRLILKPLNERQHDLTIKSILPLQYVSNIADTITETARSIKTAQQNKKSVVFMMGAHVLRDGVQRYLIDLMEQGYINCIAMNGAGVIHDFEFSFAGATTESVARYIRNGQFGLWQETGVINSLVKQAAEESKGIGESIGRFISEQSLPHADTSVLAAGWRLGIPVTVHAGIGYDIVHEHPNCDGSAWGQTSYTDFLIFTKVLENIAGGVVMNFGSAVMGPEIFLKALAMVRNVLFQSGNHIHDFTSLVCDLKPLPDTYNEEADRNDPFYYFRPWKTLLVRTIAGSGTSHYIRDRHLNTIPALWTALTQPGTTP
jgi:hypothetical protein